MNYMVRKQYMVVESARKNFYESRTICKNLGGMLPEPRNELDNNFLDSISYKSFYLGMRDSSVEGYWAFESDYSKVAWKNWVRWSDHANPPNGGTNENCAIMLKDYNKNEGGHNPKAWVDIKCSQPIGEMDVICEKGDDIFTSYLSDIISYIYQVVITYFHK